MERNHTWWRIDWFRWHWVTFDPAFNVTTFLKSNISITFILGAYHRLRTWVAQHCYNGDVRFLWENMEFWPVKFKPLNILSKFVTVDYVHEGKVRSKFGKNPFTGDCWANSWNVTFLWLYFFFWGTHRDQTLWPILTHDGSKCAESCKDVPWG